MRAFSIALTASSVLVLAAATSHNPTGKSLRGLQQQQGDDPLAGASWSLAQDLPLDGKGEGAKRQREEHEVIIPRKDVVLTDNKRRQQPSDPLAGAFSSLAQDLPSKGEAAKEQGEEPKVIMPRKEAVDKVFGAPWSLLGGSSPATRAAVGGGGEERGVIIPRKEAVPVSAGGDKQQQQARGEHEVIIPRKEAVPVSAGGDKQQQQNADPLAGASWSLAQDLSLKGKAAKEQGEEPKVIIPRKEVVFPEGGKQQEGTSDPLAGASWSLARVPSSNKEEGGD